MKNRIIDIETLQKKTDNGDLGELLLPRSSIDFDLTLPKNLNDEIEILRSSSKLLDFIPHQVDRAESLWKIDIVYRSNDSQARYATLACSVDSEYSLQISGRKFYFNELENALTCLLTRGLFDNDCNNHAHLP